MEWHRIILTHTQIEQEGALNRLKEQFLTAFMKAADNADMALLSDNDYQNARIGIYFSPACSPACDTLLRFYEAAPCEVPPRSGAFVLAGDDDILDSLN